MTTALATLHSQLQQLRLWRRLVRVGLAWSAFLSGVLLTLAVAFLLDWTLEMSRVQRAILLLVSCGAVYWAFRTYAWPWLFVRESDVDLALIVERNQKIDSDLVAALQFARPEASGWGSPQLARAVIDYVDDFSSHLNIFEGFSYRRLRRRLWVGGAILLVALLWTAIFPGHVGAFLNRLLLGSAHYPTETQIVRIEVNGTPTLSTEETLAESAAMVRSAQGEPVKFAIRCRGVLPRDGLVRLSSLSGDSIVEVPVTTASGPDAPEALFQGELPRLVDSLSYQVFLGDAWTDPLTVEAIPRPIVTVELNPRPPRYAEGHEEAVDQKAGARQIAVLEGSKVDLAVRCGNKGLKSVVLTIPELTERREWPLKAADGERRQWTLDAGDSPLANVRQPLRFEIQVVDEDGLSLERPLQGYIRLKADRPPRVAAAIVSRRVVPTARPRIAYGAADDFGISRLLARVEIARRDGRSEESTREIVSGGGRPERVLRGEYGFDLAPLQLEKGDELKLTLVAYDDRGEQEPRSTVSEPLVLQVTDREGILAGLQESDQKSAQQLDAIIQRELGIGESK